MKTSEIAPLGVRMPPDLKAHLKAAAETNRRSLNAEINARLQQSLDREFEWRPVEEATVDGILYELRFRDRFGTWEDRGPFFFHEDGLWYRYEPPTQMKERPTHFRRAQAEEEKAPNA